MKRTSMKVGDKVTIFVNPLRHAVTERRQPGRTLCRRLLQDGEKLGRTDGKGAGSAN